MKGSKLWVSWPVVIDAATLDNIYRLLSSPGGEVVLLVDEDPVQVPDWAVDSVSNFLTTDTTVVKRASRSITLIAPKFVVHLGPKTVYAYATEAGDFGRASITRIRDILQEAKWRPGNVLYRAWGGLVIVPLVFAFGYFISGGTNLYVPALSATLSLVVAFATLAVVGLRRVRIDLRASDRGRSVWVDQTLGAIFGVFTAVAVAVVLDLLGLSN